MANHLLENWVTTPILRGTLPTSQPLLWPRDGMTECAQVRLEASSASLSPSFLSLGGFTFLSFFAILLFPLLFTAFNTPWAATYIVNKRIVPGWVFNKEFLCIYHCHSNEHSFFFSSPLDDLIPLVEELASLVRCQ